MRQLRRHDGAHLGGAGAQPRLLLQAPARGARQDGEDTRFSRGGSCEPVRGRTQHRSWHRLCAALRKGHSCGPCRKKPAGTTHALFPYLSSMRWTGLGTGTSGLSAGKAGLQRLLPSGSTTQGRCPDSTCLRGAQTREGARARGM